MNGELWIMKCEVWNWKYENLRVKMEIYVWNWKGWKGECEMCKVWDVSKEVRGNGQNGQVAKGCPIWNEYE